MGINIAFFYRGRIITAILVCIILLVQVASAQKLDSLLGVLKEHPFDDTTRVTLLARVAGVYQRISPDSMMAVANQGLALATKMNFEKGKAMCLSQIGTALIIKNQYTKALDVHTQALNIYEKIGNLPGIAAACHNIGNVYYTQTKFGPAMEYYTRSKEISEKTNDVKNTGLELNSIGNIYKDLGDYSLAIQYFLNSLKLLEKEKDNEDIPVTLTNIATVYSTMGDYTQALDYIHKSIALDIATGNEAGRLYNIVNIGVINGEKKDYKSALTAFNEGLHLADSLHDPYWKTTCQANIAEAYYFLGDYDEAFRKYTEALEAAKKIKEISTVAGSENGLGNLFIKKGQITEGIKHLLAAFGIVAQIGAKEPMFEIAHDLTDAYEKNHDYAHALQYHKIYFDLRDSLFNEKSDKRIQQLQFDYELGKKENQIQLLEKNKAIEQSRIEKQRVVLWALISGVALLIIIVIILYGSRKQIKKSKDNILKQKGEIQEQARKLEELNRFKDKTFSVLSHDLRGPLNGVAATMAMLDGNVISANEFALLMPEINEQIGALNILVDNLLNWAKSYIQGQTTALPETTSLCNMARQNIKLVQNVADKKQIAIQNNIPDPAIIFSDPGQTDIILRNLLMNAVKFTNHNGTITLAAVPVGDMMKMTITDTGVGMTQEQIKKLFAPIAGNSTYGTDGEVGTGLGLLLCYEFIKANNGSISVTSELGKGSTFTIILPASPGAK